MLTNWVESVLSITFTLNLIEKLACVTFVIVKPAGNL